MEQWGVLFEGGSGCNYMLCIAKDRDGNRVAMDSEYLEPDYSDFEDFEYNEDYYNQFLKSGWTLEKIVECFPDGEGLDLEQFFDTSKFDKVSYQALKAEILKQAEECNVDPETLVSYWNANYSY